MRGSEIAKQLPAGSGLEQRLAREAAIRSAVNTGHALPLDLVSIRTRSGPFTATIWVAQDALRLGDEQDNFRPSVMMKTAQQIADDLGVVLATPYIEDAVYEQALETGGDLMPVILGTKNMSSLSQMLKHSQLVQEQVDAKFPSGAPASVPFAPVGKIWAIGRRLWEQPETQGHPTALNYGWHAGPEHVSKRYGSFGTPPFPAISALNLQAIGGSAASRKKWCGKKGGCNYGAWQGSRGGAAHNWWHQDYSQIVGRLVERTVLVCDERTGTCEPWDIEALAASPELAGLVSNEGALKGLRHPKATTVPVLPTERHYVHAGHTHPLPAPPPSPPAPQPPPSTPPEPVPAGAAGGSALAMGAAALAAFYTVKKWRG